MGIHLYLQNIIYFIEEAQKEMIRYESEFVPNKVDVSVYKEYYNKYKKMYQMMKELYK